ncbi:hypothetical protein HanIR_Chr17g0855291 [Helianthus annuus]|nr:hypothetical protein HanIR_Chr17g0855291 [Helianthus annuus]
MAVDSLRTPHSMACLVTSETVEFVSDGNTFSHQSSYLRLPFHKPRAVLKVLVVSRSFRRANHSSERWAGAPDGLS